LGVPSPKITASLWSSSDSVTSSVSSTWTLWLPDPEASLRRTNIPVKVCEECGQVKFPLVEDCIHSFLEERYLLLFPREELSFINLNFAPVSGSLSVINPASNVSSPTSFYYSSSWTPYYSCDISPSAFTPFFPYDFSFYTAVSVCLKCCTVLLPQGRGDCDHDYFFKGNLALTRPRDLRRTPFLEEEVTDVLGVRKSNIAVYECKKCGRVKMVDDSMELLRRAISC